jgi:hypothetical protein
MAMNFQFLILFLALAGNPSAPPAPDNPVDKNCTFNGKKLYGKIKFVENFPDIKVQIVENFPDLKVKLVSNFPDECGKWQIVENFPDIKVQLVENFPDIKVKFVENFPGMP